MGGERKPIGHAYLRGGGKKRQIVVLGAVVGFFALLSMTGLGHSHNPFPQEMPRHAALATRHAGDGHPSDHRDFGFANHAAVFGGGGDRDDKRKSSIHPKKHAHTVLFGTSIEDAIGNTAKQWLHDVVDSNPKGDDAHKHHGHGHQGTGHVSLTDELHDTAVGLGRGAHVAGILSSSLMEKERSVRASLSGRDSMSLDSLARVAAGQGILHNGGGLGTLAKMSAANHLVTDGMRRDGDGGDGDGFGAGHVKHKAFTAGELIWHPPPALGVVGESTDGIDSRVLIGDEDHDSAMTRDTFAGTLDTFTKTRKVPSALTTGTDGDERGTAADGERDRLQSDPADDDAVASKRVAVNANTQSVLLSCERCAFHGMCALGGGCECVAMFMGKACRATRVLEAIADKEKGAEKKIGKKKGGTLERTNAVADFVLDGFARGFGGSFTLTKENAPSKLEARPDAADDAARTNKGIEVDDQDDWLKPTFDTQIGNGGVTGSAETRDDAEGRDSLVRLGTGDASFELGFGDARKRTVGLDPINGGVGSGHAKPSVSAVTHDWSVNGRAFGKASGDGSGDNKQSSVFTNDDIGNDPPPAPPAQFGKITSHTRTRLPERGPFDETVFKTCAVVGSGGFHASVDAWEQLGTEIDTHDAVFRFGDDPVVGYENVVGKKTTFRFVVDDANTNPMTQYEGEVFARTEKGKKRQSRESARESHGVASEGDSLEKTKATTVRFVRDSVGFKRYLAARLAKPDSDAHVAHPEFLNWIDNALSFQPGAEMYGVFVAAHVCREVNLYGFQTQSFHGLVDLYHEHGVGELSFASRGFDKETESVGKDFGTVHGKDTDSLGKDSRFVHTASTATITPSREVPTGGSLDARELVILERMHQSGLVHFAEPCLLECHATAAACDACFVDTDSVNNARNAIGRVARKDARDDPTDPAEDDANANGIEDSLDNWVSGITGAFAHGGFEHVEKNYKPNSAASNSVGENANLIVDGDETNEEFIGTGLDVSGSSRKRDFDAMDASMGTFVDDEDEATATSGFGGASGTRGRLGRA